MIPKMGRHKNGRAFRVWPGAVLVMAFLLGAGFNAAALLHRSQHWRIALGAEIIAEPADANTPGPVTRFRQTTAAALLESLEVKAPVPRTGYGRDKFGSAWSDVDGNGCDTRNDVLRRDLRGVTVQPGSGCLVAAGNLLDPYTGRQIDFRRGPETSGAVQIDHVVALSDAWQKGAQSLQPGQRLAFANDPLNLIAVDGPANVKKSDADAAGWLPPNQGYRCGYVARQVSVKAAYGLWVTEAEKRAMAEVLGGCMMEPSLASGL